LDTLVIYLASVVTSGLSRFSEFGPRTVLMPVFAPIFPLSTARASGQVRAR